MFDIVIKGGRVIDGTGSPSFFADVAIKDGKIARVGKKLEGKDVIDATGLVVTPGFIDSHSHADAAVFSYPEQIEKVEQGITTSIAGQCGSAIAPTKDMSMGEFFDKVKEVPQGANIVTLIGHSNLRRVVMGIEDRDPTAEEMKQMEDILRDGMEKGALGMSLGLIYTPSCSAKPEELISLAKIVGEYGGIIAAHIRNESEFVMSAVEEFINIAKGGNVRAVVSHHKSTKKENWGKVNATLRVIDEANEEGYDVYCDVYPYIASHTDLTTTFIPQALRGEGRDAIVAKLKDKVERQKLIDYNVNLRKSDCLDWVLIANCPEFPEYRGKRVTEIAKMRGVSDYNAMFDILEACGGSACYFTMCEEDVEMVMAHPRAMICTDSGVAGKQQYHHPRVRGSFPRVLGRYVRERGVTTLHEMIRKMTSMPAAVYGLSGKGLIREGMDADICIFDPEKIIDRADYVDCFKRAEGLNYVLVGGEVVAENAVHNGKKCGKVILRK